MTDTFDSKDFLLLLAFLIILILFLVFISSHYFLILRFKAANILERWRIRRLKNKERRTNERFKFKTKNFTSEYAAKTVEYINFLMDKNETFLLLGNDRYFDLELTAEEGGLFSLILFRPYTEESPDIDAFPKIKRTVESEITIDLNNLVVYYQLAKDDEEKLIRGLTLEESIKAAIIISKEYMIKSYRLTRFDQLA